MSRERSRPRQSLALGRRRCYVRAQMSFPRSLAVALVGLGMTAGCASRQTQAARAAWKQAVRGDDTTPARGDGSGDDRKTGDTADPNT